MEPTVSQILKTVGLYGVRFQYGHCDLVLDRLLTTQTDEFRAVRAAAYGISRSWSTGRLSPVPGAHLGLASARGMASLVARCVVELGDLVFRTAEVDIWLRKQDLTPLSEGRMAV